MELHVRLAQMTCLWSQRLSSLGSLHISANNHHSHKNTSDLRFASHFICQKQISFILYRLCKAFFITFYMEHLKFGWLPDRHFHFDFYPLSNINKPYFRSLPMHTLSFWVWFSFITSVIRHCFLSTNTKELRDGSDRRSVYLVPEHQQEQMSMRRLLGTRILHVANSSKIPSELLPSQALETSWASCHIRSNSAWWTSLSLNVSDCFVSMRYAAGKVHHKLSACFLKVQ